MRGVREKRGTSEEVRGPISRSGAGLTAAELASPCTAVRKHRRRIR